MTRPRDRRELSESASGVVRVRLQGDTLAADMLAQVLRQHPSVEILTGPDRYDGGRQYLLVRVSPPEEAPARAEAGGAR